MTGVEGEMPITKSRLLDEGKDEEEKERVSWLPVEMRQVYGVVAPSARLANVDAGDEALSDETCWEV